MRVWAPAITTPTRLILSAAYKKPHQKCLQGIESRGRLDALIRKHGFTSNLLSGDQSPHHNFNGLLRARMNNPIRTQNTKQERLHSARRTQANNSGYHPSKERPMQAL